MWLSHHASQSSSSHPLFPFTLYCYNTHPPHTHTHRISPNKIQKKRNRKEEKKNLVLEDTVWHSDSHSILFNSYSITCKCLLQLTIGLLHQAFGFWYTRYWVLTGVSLGYPVVLYNGVSASIALASSPS